MKKQLIGAVQGNESIASYSNKLMKYLEELNCLEPRPNCGCECCKKMEIIAEKDSSMTFLMGLNEAYEAIVNTRNFNKKKEVTKKDRYCNYCNKAGHLEEACFKKFGYPDWFKEFKNKKNQSAVNAVSGAVAVETEQKKESDLSSISEMVQREVKYLKSKERVESPVAASYFADFAGSFDDFTTSYSSHDEWIIDSGASSNVCGNLNMFSEIKEVAKKNTVQIPDGSVKVVKYIGKKSVWCRTK
ncbi:uncharacterized protein G2W53_015473 [Senna tora]|uniref:Retrovirus-related Pol polyprotein from transposon TNT 1-94-like beta-barrel domain-containing protein n=1 Tax=Senna tora TaxID=362788 RepID=A0A834WVM9_9FABA|nr:uncharacterized protein G2W53_015473 [Senna tora]